MSAELSLSILNPTIAWAIAALVATLYWRWRQHVHLLPLSIAFFQLGMAFTVQEWRASSHSSSVNYVSNALFFGAVLLACVSAMVRVKAPLPVGAIATTTIVTFMGFMFFAWVVPSTPNRILLLNAAFAVLTGLTIRRLLAAGVRTFVDRLFVAGAALGALTAVTRAIVYVQASSIEPGMPIADTGYWNSILGITPLMAILVASVFIFALVYEIVSELQRAAEEDHLTGLLNRRGFERAATSALKGRQGGPSVLVADIDDFKQVNDRFGHAAGDQVIASVGKILAQYGRADAAARIGGEEYALFYSDASLDDLREVADDVAAALSSQPVPGMPQTYRPTISIGLYRRAALETLDDMLRSADHALYRAKAGGKNRAAVTRSLRSA